MNIDVCYTLKINAPNVRWNTYECIRKTGFWGKETYYIRVKDRYGDYAKEEHKVVGDDWRFLEHEIGLINWFLKEKIYRSDLEYIKSSDFLDLCKEYQNMNSISVDMMLERPTSTQMLIKKRWALELWDAYQNNYHLNGIRTFKISGKSIGYALAAPGSVGVAKFNNTWYNAIEVDSPFWEWLEKYKLVY